MNDPQPDVSILIVSYNTKALTLRCLSSVFAETEDILYEVLIADNASSDGSASAIAENFPQARLYAFDENLGFAKANNELAKHATGRCLLLLNPDTEILDGAIQKALAFHQSLKVPAVVGGRSVFADGSLNPTSVHALPSIWSLLCMGVGFSSLFRRSRLFDPESLGRWGRDSVREVGFISGCFLLISRPLWIELAGFDTSFFMYGEDADLCVRAGTRGVRSILCPEATIIHHGGASESVRSDKMVRLFRAKSQLLAKHWSASLARFGAAMFSLWAFTRMVGHGLLSPLRPASRRAATEWHSVWRRRAQWKARVSQARKTPKVFAVASAGGHWSQLMQLRDAFASSEVIYVGTNSHLRETLQGQTLETVPDCNARTPTRLLRCAFSLIRLLVRHRPDVIVTTGAAPGCLAVLLGRLFGARTLWIDSVANATRLSLSGRIAKHICHRTLTQWPHLEEPGRVQYRGSVL